MNNNVVLKVFIQIEHYIVSVEQRPQPLRNLGKMWIFSSSRSHLQSVNHPSSCVGEVASPKIVVHQGLPPCPTQQRILYNLSPLKSFWLNALLDVACFSTLCAGDVVVDVISAVPFTLPGVSKRFSPCNETDGGSLDPIGHLGRVDQHCFLCIEPKKEEKYCTFHCCLYHQVQWEGNNVTLFPSCWTWFSRSFLNNLLYIWFQFVSPV